MLTLLARLIVLIATIQPQSQAPTIAQTQPAPLTPLAHIEQRGSGPVTMILIPGLACDWRVFDAFMTRNESKYTMYAVTLPGFGDSQPPPKDSDWIDNAERAVVQLVHEKKLDHPIVVGHSLGGHTVTRLAIHHPEDFRAAISLDGLPLYPLPQPGQPDSPQARQAMAKAISDRMNAMTDEQSAQNQHRMFAFMVADPKRAEELATMYEKVPRATSLQYMCELVTTDLRPLMKDVKIPLLTISAVSLEMGPQAAEQIHAGVKKEFEGASKAVTLKFIDGSRHFVMDDKPAEMDALIDEFVKSLNEKSK